MYSAVSAATFWDLVGTLCVCWSRGIGLGLGLDKIKGKIHMKLEGTEHINEIIDKVSVCLKPL